MIPFDLLIAEGSAVRWGLLWVFQKIEILGIPTEEQPRWEYYYEGVRCGGKKRVFGSHGGGGAGSRRGSNLKRAPL